MKSHTEHHPYRGFILMIAISFVVMYAIMLMAVDRSAHVRLNSMTTYMTLMMTASMAVVMIGLMGSMYRNKRLNSIIILSGIAVFCVSLWFLRAETFVGDKQFLKSMIPHHSSAILMSEEATLHDPQVRALAQKIIQAQEQEIAEMDALLNKLNGQPRSSTRADRDHP
jgi:uncharacterized protein (DUF305 family)